MRELLRMKREAAKAIDQAERTRGVSRSIHVCLQVTYRCNLRCHDCYACCDLLRGEGTDMTLEQVERFCEEVRPFRLKAFRIAGGEPTLLPELHDMVWMIHHRCNFRGHYAHVSTNGSGRRFRLPPGWKWRVSSPRKKVGLHEPWLWSPADIGETPSGYLCKRPKMCGMGYDYKGWSFCQAAAAFSRLLGIEIHTADRRLEYIEEVCRHCPWSLSNAHLAELLGSARWKRVTIPTPTWAAALARAGITR